MAEIIKHVVKARLYKEPGQTSWSWSVPGGRNTSGYIHSKDYAGNVAVKLGFDDKAWLQYWLFNKRVYVTADLELLPDDVAALVNETENKRRLRLEKAHALQAMTRQLDTRAKRATIPQDVKVLVWQRDAGRCVTCDSKSSLEFDHIIPVAMGGSNTARNLQLLCEACNRRKGATLG